MRAQNRVMKTKPTALNSGLAAKKAALLAKLAEVEGTATGRDELVVQTSPDEIDMITMAADRDLVVQQINQSDRVLRDVRAALEALERGEYGVCVDCEEPISTRRLEVLPWAQLCVRCQDAQERQGHESGEIVFLQAA
jgi:RNA polymerase-binding protein DksA